MQNPKENNSAKGEEPLWMIAAESAARRDVQVGIHEDVYTYGNEQTSKVQPLRAPSIRKESEPPLRLNHERSAGFDTRSVIVLSGVFDNKY